MNEHPAAPNANRSDLTENPIPDKPKMEAKKDKGVAPSKVATDGDMFRLEKMFPNAHEVFRPSSVPDPNADCLVALDTNALLLPYVVAKDDLKRLGAVYSEIAQRGRLYLPERVAREFVKNRDRKLAEMIHAISNEKSKIYIGSGSIAPMLVGLAEHENLTKASEDLAASKKAYVAALDALSSQIRSWRGDDPVTSLYATLFVKERLVGPDESEADLKEQLAYRFLNGVPPGYKDSGKADGGIGDFAIWRSLLKLGAREKKDLIFVTGEEKSDWFVKAGGESVYPRPELVDEYRRASGGSTIRLSTLHDLLREMNAPEDLVSDVKVAEVTANTAIFQASVQSSPILSSLWSAPSVSFDYSTNNGILIVQHAGKSFSLAFSKASDSYIHLYLLGTMRRIARIREMAINVPISIDEEDTSAGHYTIQVGEGFLVENQSGDVLAGRIIRILDDTRGADHDEVTFSYHVFDRGTPIVLPP